MATGDETRKEEKREEKRNERRDERREESQERGEKREEREEGKEERREEKRREGQERARLEGGPEPHGREFACTPRAHRRRKGAGPRRRGRRATAVHRQGALQAVRAQRKARTGGPPIGELERPRSARAKPRRQSRAAQVPNFGSSGTWQQPFLSLQTRPSAERRAWPRAGPWRSPPCPPQGGSQPKRHAWSSRPRKSTQKKPGHPRNLGARLRCKQAKDCIDFNCHKSFQNNQLSPSFGSANKGTQQDLCGGSSPVGGVGNWQVALAHSHQMWLPSVVINHRAPWRAACLPPTWWELCGCPCAFAPNGYICVLHGCGQAQDVGCSRALQPPAVAGVSAGPSLPEHRVVAPTRPQQCACPLRHGAQLVNRPCAFAPNVRTWCSARTWPAQDVGMWVRPRMGQHRM